MTLVKIFTIVVSIIILNTTIYAKEVLIKKVFKGEAVIIVEGKTYTLPLYTCYSATNTVKGKSSQDFVTKSYMSRKSTETDPRFSAYGRGDSVKSKILYNISIKGGVMKGGTDYKGKISFKNLEGNKLHYEGDTEKRKKVLGKFAKTIEPIEFTVTCK